MPRIVSGDPGKCEVSWRLPTMPGDRGAPQAFTPGVPVVTGRAAVLATQGPPGGRGGSGSPFFEGKALTVETSTCMIPLTGDSRRPFPVLGASLKPIQ